MNTTYDELNILTTRGNNMTTTYDDFIESEQAKKHKPLMHHLPSEVTYASKFFPGYLTNDEMQERQFTGRYWYVSYNNEGFIISNRPALFIILDNETVLAVHYDEDDDIVEGVYDRANTLVYLPDSLRGMYYND